MNATETEVAHGDTLAQSLVDEVMVPLRQVESWAEALELVLSQNISVHCLPVAEPGEAGAFHACNTIFVRCHTHGDWRVRTIPLMEQFAHLLLLRRPVSIPFEKACVIAKQFAGLAID